MDQETHQHTLATLKKAVTDQEALITRLQQVSVRHTRSSTSQQRTRSGWCTTCCRKTPATSTTHAAWFCLEAPLLQFSSKSCWFQRPGVLLCRCLAPQLLAAAAARGKELEVWKASANTLQQEVSRLR